MNHCAARGCPDPPCTLRAIDFITHQKWYFCRQHFWKGVHTLLNRGAEAVIVDYQEGGEHVDAGNPTVEGPKEYPR